jgi:hypothetical protein
MSNLDFKAKLKPTSLTQIIYLITAIFPLANVVSQKKATPNNPTFLFQKHLEMRTTTQDIRDSFFCPK